MISFEGFTLLILFFILAPIIGAIALLFLFIFEKRIDLLENRNVKIELEKELQQALYNQLNQQIQPHFLFNTLNVILSLARLNRTRELVRALEVLSQFLKFKYKSTEPLISLRREIDYTEQYLEIQKLRFGSRLSIHTDCPDDLLMACIPPFVLQTLVENAFKHGLERKMGEAVLQIRLSSDDDKVRLEVIDNGSSNMDELLHELPLDTDPPLEKSGHGLDNIRRRLHLCFGDHAQLSLTPQENGGTQVLVEWPYVMCDPYESEVRG
ncbi:sensor histidine kinase [Brevibacillus choshinensis]|uniref:sensor histidine kinase n=1 Tax=Brevibacillus choshinensis TaxID=54911 RepID=UPI002E24991A|nr:histidine kinase [Brevibacillus choshinensis]MED4781840.1 histidine kinase [Brevibacillus choshinensis]